MRSTLTISLFVISVAAALVAVPFRPDEQAASASARDPLRPDWVAEIDTESSFFGTSVGTAGDVNGDGFDDVIVGANFFENPLFVEGGAFVYQGSVSGLALTPAWTAEGDKEIAQFGFSVGTAGDVNGDGFDDVIVGAIQYDYGQDNTGAAFVFHGSASGLSLAPDWTAGSGRSGAGFGSSVGTAGDVNGDGFDDVIVGAWTYTNGQLWEGAAFVYQGSASGLSLTPAWTTESDQESAFLGYSSGTAGDVNGDGFDDVIVGAHDYTNGQEEEGGAFVFHGSASGLSITPAWTAEGDQTAAHLGLGVGPAGDVNGDGFDEVIVGAPHYDYGPASPGAAFVYDGSASGLSLTASWRAHGDQGGGPEFGWSVGTAGDINGDGFDEVIVGARYYDNGQADEGRVFVYRGSASGLGRKSAISESDQYNAIFGDSVGTAGDVNGDGFDEVIVGAPQYDHGQENEGGAFVWYGPRKGLA